jgi:hypothetical protein
VAVNDKGGAAAVPTASVTANVVQLTGSHLGASWSLSSAIRAGEAVAQIGRPSLLSGGDDSVNVMWAAGGPAASPDTIEWTWPAPLR